MITLIVLSILATPTVLILGMFAVCFFQEPKSIRYGRPQEQEDAQYRNNDPDHLHWL